MPGLFDHIELDQFFDITDKNNQEILRNGGFINYFDKNHMKKMFATYLMGKKGMTLYDILENEEGKKVSKYRLMGQVDREVLNSTDIYTEARGIVNLTDEEKKSLGEQFLADIRKRPIYGEVKGGQKEVEDNLAWYGEMFSNAADSVALSSDSYPLAGNFNSVDAAKNFLNSEQSAISELGADFIMQTDLTYARRSNRSTKDNNYGVDMGKAFIKGYGGVKKYNRDVNRMKCVNVIGSYAKQVNDAATKGDIPEAVASLMAGQIACNYHNQMIGKRMGVMDDEGEFVVEKISNEDVVEEYLSFESVDKDPLLGDKMELAASTLYLNFKPQIAKLNNKELQMFNSYLKGNNTNQQVEKISGQLIEATSENTYEGMLDSNVVSVSRVIDTINMNNNSVIYNYVDYDKNENAPLIDPEYAVLLMYFNMDKADLSGEGEAFDEIFASLVDAEQMYADLAENKDIFSRFKINGKTVRELVSSKDDYRALYNATSDDVCKHIVINAMASRSCKLTYSPYKLNNDDWNKADVSDENIEIKQPANIAKMTYTSIKGLRRDIEGIIGSYEELKLIDSKFHINRKLFKNVKNSLAAIKTMAENIYEKDPMGETVISDVNMKKLLAHFDKAVGEMNVYIEAREGARSELGKRRLKKIKSLLGNINVIRHNLIGAEELYNEIDIPYNEKDDIIKYDWRGASRLSSKVDYVADEEYTKEMKDIYSRVMTPDEEYQHKIQKKNNNKIENKDEDKDKAQKAKARAAMVNKLKKNLKKPPKSLIKK